MMRVNVLTLPPTTTNLTANRLRKVVGQYDARLDAVAKHLGPDRVRELSSKKLIAGDIDELTAALDWCGLTFKQAAVLDFIDPKLFRGSGGTQ